jgi:hypothetical protein
VAVSCQLGNELLGSIKGGESVDWLTDYLLLKKDSAPWEGIQLIVRLDPAADTARFSHRPAAVADYSRPAFPL